MENEEANIAGPAAKEDSLSILDESLDAVDAARFSKHVELDRSFADFPATGGSDQSIWYVLRLSDSPKYECLVALNLYDLFTGFEHYVVELNLFRKKHYKIQHWDIRVVYGAGMGNLLRHFYFKEERFTKLQVLPDGVSALDPTRYGHGRYRHDRLRLIVSETLAEMVQDVVYYWDFLPDLWHTFVADLAIDNTLQAVDARRMSGNHHSLSSWHLVDSHLNRQLFDRYEKTGIYQDSNALYFFVRQALADDGFKLYGNERFIMTHQEQISATQGTRPSKEHVEAWMYLSLVLNLQATNPAERAIWNYFNSVLALALGLADPQGMCHLPIMTNTHIDSKTKEAWVELLRRFGIEAFAIGQTTLGEMIRSPTFEMIVGMGGFIDSEAPILGVIKASNEYARLLPVVLIEMQNGKTTPHISYPYSNTQVKKLPVNHPVQQAQAHFASLIRTAWIQQPRRPSRLRLVAPDMISPTEALSLAIGIPSEWADFRYEIQESKRIQLYRSDDWSIVAIGSWQHLKSVFPALSITDFISKGHADTTLASYTQWRRSDINTWAPLVIRLVQAARSADRIALFVELTKAVGFVDRRTTLLQQHVQSIQNIIETAVAHAKNEERIDEANEASASLNFWTNTLSKWWARRRVELTKAVGVFFNLAPSWLVSIQYKPTLPLDFKLDDMTRWFDVEAHVYRVVNHQITIHSMPVPLLRWAFQYSAYRVEEIFNSQNAHAWITSMPQTLGEALSMPYALRMDHTGLNKPIWYTMLHQRAPTDEKRFYGYQESGPAVVRLQHLAMLAPQNYALLLALCNGMFEEAWELVNNVEHVALFDRLVKTGSVASQYLEDAIMANFFMGLSIRLERDPSFLVLVKSYIQSDYSNLYQYLLFSGPSPPDGRFNFMPGALTLTEVTRTGNLTLLEFLISKTKPALFLEAIKVTMLPSYFYSLPDPYRLMTPNNLFKLQCLLLELNHGLLTIAPEVTAFMKQTVELFPPQTDLNVMLKDRTLDLIEHRERETKQVVNFSLVGMLKSFIVELEQKIPRYYSNKADILLDASTDHVMTDPEYHFIPAALQVDEMDDDEESERLQLEFYQEHEQVSIEGRDLTLARAVSQCTSGTDVDRLVMSHHRAWTNFYILCVKRAQQAPTNDALVLAMDIDEPITLPMDDDLKEFSLPPALPIVRSEEPVVAQQEDMLAIILPDQGGDDDNEADDEEENGTGSRPAFAARSTPKYQQYEESFDRPEDYPEYLHLRSLTVQTFRDIRDSTATPPVWFNDVTQPTSAVQTVLRAAHEYNRDNLEAILHSYLATLTIPVLLGNLLLRVDQWMDDLVHLRRHNTTKEKFVRNVKLHFELGEPKPTMWFYQKQLLQVDEALVLGLQMVVPELDLKSIIPRMHSALLDNLILTLTDQSNKSPLVTPTLIQQWLTERWEKRTPSQQTFIKKQFDMAKLNVEHIKVDDVAPKAISLAPVLEVSSEEETPAVTSKLIERRAVNELANGGRALFRLRQAQLWRRLQNIDVDIAVPVQRFARNAAYSLHTNTPILLASLETENDQLRFETQRDLTKHLVSLLGVVPTSLYEEGLQQRLNKLLQKPQDLLFYSILNPRGNGRALTSAWNVLVKNIQIYVEGNKFNKNGRSFLWKWLVGEKNVDALGFKQAIVSNTVVTNESATFWHLLLFGVWPDDMTERARHTFNTLFVSLAQDMFDTPV